MEKTTHWMDEPQDSKSYNHSENSPLYKKLKDSLEPLYDQRGQKGLWDELADHLDSARSNAEDTVRENLKAKPSQRFYEDMLKGSLESVLSYASPSGKAKAHWAKHGITP